jgi:hypothetical protein
LGFRFRFRVPAPDELHKQRHRPGAHRGLTPRIQPPGLIVLELILVSSGFRVQGSGFRVQGLGFRV